jgi:hypothetical protein
MEIFNANGPKKIGPVEKFSKIFILASKEK